jgi:hypothetical protein
MLPVLLPQAEVHGVVKDAQSGEPLARVSVQVIDPARHVLTGANGTFTLGALEAGDYILKVSTVGYRLLQTHLVVGPGESQELHLALSPDTVARTDRIEVRADAFELERAGNSTEFVMDGNEIKNLSTVLADDPLRAVQTMPGVSSNDDFDSRFSLHGAPYQRVGLYLDDILLHMPFHTVQGEGPSGSLTVFNGDMVDSMSLQSEAYSPRFEDRTAGILDVHTRDGSRSQTSVRATIGAPDAGIMAEGPLGAGHHGSWIASFRKSYLQYFVQQSTDQPSMAFGFMDSQAQFNYDLSAHNTVKLKLVDGTSDFDRTDYRDRLALNASMLARYHFSLANLEWQYTPSATFLVTSHAAFMRERYDDTNRDTRTLGEGFYGEWTGRTDARWMWDRSATLDFGVSLRRVRGDGFADYYFDSTARTRVEGHSGSVNLLGGYLQQSWSGLKKRVQISGGVRWDSASTGGPAVVSPQASVAVLPTASTRLQFSWGRYAQFPDVEYLYSIYGSTSLRPERATHYSAAIEQRLGRQARLRVEAFQRVDRDLLFRPFQESRLVAGQIVPDNFQAPLTNSLSGTSKGIEVFLQKRTANRLTGWVSYALQYSRQHDALSGAAFAADQDQRHTVNVYLGYRIRPSVNLSAKWTYGSGFPIAGYFRRDGDAYFLSALRNGARLDPYQRTDVRINKARSFDRWKVTVYAEVVNLLNRPNYRFDSYNGYDPATGRAYVNFSNMFPILPSAGLMLEF